MSGVYLFFNALPTPVGLFISGFVALIVVYCTIKLIDKIVSYING